VTVTDEEKKNILINSSYFVLNNLLLPKSKRYGESKFDEFFMFFCNKLRPLLEEGKDCGSNTLQGLDEVTSHLLSKTALDVFEKVAEIEELRRKEELFLVDGGVRKSRRRVQKKKLSSKKLKKSNKKMTKRH
jgi:hypothetical protein